MRVHSTDRFVVPGTSRGAVERMLLGQRADPDADWLTYHLPAVSAGGESVRLPTAVRLDQQGDDVVVETTYRLTAWPMSGRRIWFRLAVLDAERLLRQSLGAPAERVDKGHTQEMIAGAVAGRKRYLRRANAALVVCGVAGLVLGFSSLALRQNAHSRPAPQPAGVVYEPAALQARLSMEYGIVDAQCNNNHLLHIDRLGQEFTCSTSLSTYRLTVTAIDPFEYTLTEVR